MLRLRTSLCNLSIRAILTMVKIGLMTLRALTHRNTHNSRSSTWWSLDGILREPHLVGVPQK